jgi:hypothetical protein
LHKLNEMNTYKIETDLDPDWDVNVGHVIVADNEYEARKMASDIAWGEGKIVWETAKVTNYGAASPEAPNPFIMLTSSIHG